MESGHQNGARNVKLVRFGARDNQEWIVMIAWPEWKKLDMYALRCTFYIF
jgi:hypothetical protein